MKILGLDSSGLVASVAIVEDNDLKGEYTVNYKKTHSQTLLPMLDEVAKMIDLDLNSIDAISIASGPGSFTGLRIGSATAKGLGLALGKPLIHIPTVDALAYNLAGNRDIICPLMDARRNQTYTGLYRFDGNQMEIIKPQCAVGIDEIIAEVNKLGQAVVFLGDGVAVFETYIHENCTVPYTFAPAHVNKQRAGAVAALGEIYYTEGKTETAEEHKPDYLRLSQAVAEIERQIFSQPWSRQGFLDAVNLGNTVFLVAEENNRIIGYIGMYLAMDEGEITNVAVAPVERCHGVGGMLLTELLKIAENKGVARIVLEVRASNDSAIRLYERNGFVQCGMRKGFYEFPKEDAYVMVHGH